MTGTARRSFLFRRRAGGRCVPLLLFLFGLFLPAAAQNRTYAGAQTYGDIVREMSRKYRVETELIHSIIRAESNYDRWAVSSKGAVGLMQLMPATAEEYGVSNIYDPRQNIEGGVKYLKEMIRLFDGDQELALAAYNAGQEAVKKYKGIPPYPETRRYIERIRSSYGKSLDNTGSSTIYKFYDKAGRLVFTNDRNYYLAHIK